ncbi:COMM domain-containing protein 9-like [Centruroides sculpturatus]|uniref:COMM domain-containing protein 9-like n=1 Tax=Centruroides sculpturatus TaxID=218467 RepID=UPI000C6ED330|nr:COMM domain-containing protein 9-like [Centruroides sculpturatus]
MAAVDFDSLLLLLKATSKQHVNDLCRDAFLCQDLPPKHLVVQCAGRLSIEHADALKLLNSLSSLTKLAVFRNCSTPELVASLFPSEFHKNLKELLAKIIADRFQQWESEALDNMVSLPRLKDFGWRVDMKMASSDIARINALSCILHLAIEDNSSCDSDTVSNVNVELNKETLDTMLHGLGRIRDQLSAVSRK